MRFRLVCSMSDNSGFRHIMNRDSDVELHSLANSYPQCTRRHSTPSDARLIMVPTLSLYVLLPT
jgi:hypothetical protein